MKGDLTLMNYSAAIIFAVGFVSLAVTLILLNAQRIQRRKNEIEHEEFTAQLEHKHQEAMTKIIADRDATFAKYGNNPLKAINVKTIEHGKDEFGNEG
jgi:hypothetical protein